jgi:hypothetical protein
MGLGSAHLPFIIVIDLLWAADALTLLSRFTFDNLVCSPKVMARCSPLGEATANMTKVKGADKVASTAGVTQMAGENLVVSDAEGRLLSSEAAKGSLDEGGSDDENSWTYYFSSSTVTVVKIKEMMEKWYFAEGKARALGAKTVSEPDNDEAVVYEEFFVAGLRMPPHCVLANILLKFQMQLHQLTSNAIAQLSKYF